MTSCGTVAGDELHPFGSIISQSMRRRTHHVRCLCTAVLSGQCYDLQGVASDASRRSSPFDVTRYGTSAPYLQLVIFC